MSLETNIYDFNAALEPALAAPFIAAGYATLLLTDVADKFQQVRPCLVLQLVVGAAMPKPILPVAGTRGILGENRALCYNAQTRIDVITNADIETHRAYIAKLRNFTSTFLTRLNGVTLEYHALMGFAADGESDVFKPQEGDFQSTLMFNSPFSIQINKLRELIAEES